MARIVRRRGNPAVYKQFSLGPNAFELMPKVEPTAFEKAVAEFGLQPEQYAKSRRLREWVRAHKNHRFVPEELLRAYGMVAEVRDMR